MNPRFFCTSDAPVPAPDGSSGMEGRSLGQDVRVGGGRTGGGMVLLTLASAQFLMTLDSSVMNVSIATVARDVGTTVTGIQTAITLYTLVMAAFMITGGKVGEILGRRRAFVVGAVVYGVGSAVTAAAGSLPVLILGWSVLEGLGAALIMPSVVALVAANFTGSERPRAYGLVASAGAIAVAVGPLVGGLFTSYLSWRWVFVGEVAVSLVIIVLALRLAEEPRPVGRARLDPLGTVLSAAGLGLLVYGIIRIGSWGVVVPKPGAPSLLGISAVTWLVLGGGAVLAGFVEWEARRARRGSPVLLDLTLLRIPPLRAGLVSFFFQFLLQAGLFFVVPLFLSVALGLSAVATGVRVLPLSASLLLAAVGVPRLFPRAAPRRVVRLGFTAMFVGVVVLMAALDTGVGPEVVTWPLVVIGLGVGSLASQLGSVTVSAVPDARSAEVGGVQNTVTNLGASVGTALAGAVLIAVLTSSFLTGIEHNPAVPSDLSSAATVALSTGVPFVSDAQLRAGLQARGVPPQTVQSVVEVNTNSRVDALRAALGLLALLALVAVFATRRLPGDAATGSGDRHGRSGAA